MTRTWGSAGGLEIGHADLSAELAFMGHGSKPGLFLVENTHDIIRFVCIVIAGPRTILVVGNSVMLGRTGHLVHLDGGAPAPLEP